MIGLICGPLLFYFGGGDMVVLISDTIMIMMIYKEKSMIHNKTFIKVHLSYKSTSNKDHSFTDILGYSL